MQDLKYRLQKEKNRKIMLQLNLPPYNIKVKNENGQRKIFDILRRKYLVITPEEWVRQHFIHYLIDYKGYPMSPLAN